MGSAHTAKVGWSTSGEGWEKRRTAASSTEEVLKAEVAVEEEDWDKELEKEALNGYGIVSVRVCVVMYDYMYL